MRDFKRGYKDFEKFRKDFVKQIPKERNQMKILSELTNEEITFYVNITNRTDGKTFQYLHFLILFSIYFDIGFSCICRHYDLRQSYIDNLEDVFRVKNLGIDKLTFVRKADYTDICYGDKVIGVIIELLNASDLKLHSNYLKNYPMIYYDEFLALPIDYVGDEWSMLKMIYQSIDRKGILPIIRHPKIFLTGNPINFESNILLHLKLFNSLEKSALGELVRPSKKTLLLLENNQEVNKVRNVNAFTDEEDDENVFESFIMNKKYIIDEPTKGYIILHGNEFIIELKEYKVSVNYLYENNKLTLYLSVINKYHTKKPYFCEQLKDMVDGSILLTDRFKKDLTKKYEKGLFLFDNIFSKDVLTQKTPFTNYNLFKCVYLHYQKENKSDIRDYQIKKFNENSIYEHSRFILRRWD